MSAKKREEEKDLSTKLHEEQRRDTKGLEEAQEGFAKGREGGPPTVSNRGKRVIHEGDPPRDAKEKRFPRRGSTKGHEGKKGELYEPFAKFASRWDLLPGRVVIPGSAGVPPAQDLAGSWRLASQGWSVHLPTGAGAAPLQECGRDARAPRGKPMAGQVQIRILQKAHIRK